MKIILKTLLSVLLILFASCKKLIEILPPANSITTEQTFADSSDASSAISGIYSSMLGSVSLNFLNGVLTIYCGESADELIPFYSGGDDLYANTLLADNAFMLNLWPPAYQYIYQANGVLEGVQASKGISENNKKLFLGEAKFLRSLNYFYLINLFGDVPFVNTTDYHVTSLSARTSKDQIYQQIISDLKGAQSDLPDNYELTANERTRANRWAATSLLARVYLYNHKWDSAELESSLVINATNLFNLNYDLNGVFLNNASLNNEAILQWQTNVRSGGFNATPEGFNFNPNLPPNNNPNYYLSNQLLNAFEPGDQRKVYWVDSTDYNSTIYYYPHKYKIGAAQADPTATPTEYVMVMRLAEQYLIRAEARARQSNLSGALEDLNAIRTRAGLPSFDNNLDQTQIIAAVMQERRIELFAEWGNRWLDLKRTGNVDSVMSVATPLKGQGTTWHSYQQLYPIPITEIHVDPNLTQNSGY